MPCYLLPPEKSLVHQITPYLCLPLPGGIVNVWASGKPLVTVSPHSFLLLLPPVSC